MLLASSPPSSSARLLPLLQSRTCWVNTEESCLGAVRMCVCVSMCACMQGTPTGRCPFGLPGRGEPSFRLAVSLTSQKLHALSDVGCVTLCQSLLPCKKTL